MFCVITVSFVAAEVTLSKQSEVGMVIFNMVTGYLCFHTVTHRYKLKPSVGLKLVCDYSKLNSVL